MQWREVNATDFNYSDKNRPPYSESEYRCHLFSSSFELKVNMYLSVGGTKSSAFHTIATDWFFQERETRRVKKSDHKYILHKT